MKAMTSKGKYKYYHCRDWNCGIKTIAEPVLEKQFLESLQTIQFNEEETEMFKRAVVTFRKTVEKSRNDVANALSLEMENIKSRLDGLLQKYIDQRIDEETYGRTREALLNKQIELREQRGSLEKTDDIVSRLKYRQIETADRKDDLLASIIFLPVHNRTVVIRHKFFKR